MTSASCIWSSATTTARALNHGTEADFSYLANEPLRITLQRVGRGARLRKTTRTHEFRVDHETFANLRGDALMRGWMILLDSPRPFPFAISTG